MKASREASQQYPIGHNDDGFLRPEAWTEAKKSFGPAGDVARMMDQLEQCRVACPRLMLATAIHAFLKLDDDRRRELVRDYLMNGSDGRGESDQSVPAGRRPSESRRTPRSPPAKRRSRVE